MFLIPQFTVPGGIPSVVTPRARKEEGEESDGVGFLFYVTVLI